MLLLLLLLLCLTQNMYLEIIQFYTGNKIYEYCIMKLPTEMLKSFTPLEIALCLIFALYVILPIQTPAAVAGMVDSPLGMLSVFLVTVYLFLNTHPVVAVLYVFVAYELLRRSSNKTGRVAMIKHTPSQSKKDAELKAMNPAQSPTLEEEVVSKMAPVGHSDASIYTMTSFKPVAENVGSASMY